jgi:nucleotide-binding universal stress UspA family protein
MITTVAVGLDESATAAKAVAMAAEVARRFDAELVLISAYRHADGGRSSQAGDPELEWATSWSARQRETVTRAKEKLRHDGIRCSSLTAEGDPAEVLVRLADQCSADLLVVGNKGMERRVLGSVPNTVTHKAGCSVLVVKTT